MARHTMERNGSIGFDELSLQRGPSFRRRHRTHVGQELALPEDSRKEAAIEALFNDVATGPGPSVTAEGLCKLMNNLWIVSSFYDVVPDINVDRAAKVIQYFDEGHDGTLHYKPFREAMLLMVRDDGTPSQYMRSLIMADNTAMQLIVNEKNDEIARLRSEMERMEQEHHQQLQDQRKRYETDNQELTSCLDETQDEVVQLKKLNEKIQHRLQLASSHLNLSHLEEDAVSFSLADSRSRASSLHSLLDETTLSDANSTSGEAERAFAALNEMRHENDRLHAELDQLSTQASKLNEDFFDSQDEVKALQQEVASRESEIQRITIELHDLRMFKRKSMDASNFQQSSVDGLAVELELDELKEKYDKLKVLVASLGYKYTSPRMSRRFLAAPTMEEESELNASQDSLRSPLTRTANVVAAGIAADLEEATQQNQQFLDTIDDLQAELAATQHKVQRYDEVLKRATTAAEDLELARETQKRLEAQLARLEADKKVLQDQIVHLSDQLQTSQQHLTDSQRKCSTLQQTNESLSAQLKGVSKEDTQLQQAQSKLQARVDQLEAELTTARDEASRMEQTHNQMSEQLASATKVSTSLQAQLNHTSSTLAQLNVDKSALHSEIERLKLVILEQKAEGSDALSEAEAEKHKLEEQVRRLSIETMQCSADNLELRSQLTAENASLRQELHDAMESLDRLKKQTEHSEDQKDLEQQIVTAQKQLNLKENELQARVQENETLLAQIQVLSSDLADVRAAVVGLKSNFSQQLRQAQDALADEKAGHSATRRRLQTVARNANQSTESQPQTVLVEETITEQSRLTQLQAIVDRLTNRQAEQELESDELIAEYRRKVEQLQQAVEQAEVAKMHAETQLKNTQRDLTQQQRDNEALRSQFHAPQQRTLHHDSDVVVSSQPNLTEFDCASQMRQLRSTEALSIQKMTLAEIALASERLKLTDCIEKLRSQVKLLKQQLMDSYAQSQSLRQELDTTQRLARQRMRDAEVCWEDERANLIGVIQTMEDRVLLMSTTLEKQEVTRHQSLSLIQELIADIRETRKITQRNSQTTMVAIEQAAEVIQQLTPTKEEIAAARSLNSSFSSTNQNIGTDQADSSSLALLKPGRMWERTDSGFIAGGTRRGTHTSQSLSRACSSTTSLNGSGKTAEAFIVDVCPMYSGAKRYGISGRCQMTVESFGITLRSEFYPTVRWPWARIAKVLHTHHQLLFDVVEQGEVTRAIFHADQAPVIAQTISELTMF
eukprot:m.63265 g.63265  ORF g.63265 m.63265 type:complete len:1241 (-) comp11944_c1_seq2:528-4250(-)